MDIKIEYEEKNGATFYYGDDKLVGKSTVGRDGLHAFITEKGYEDYSKYLDGKYRNQEAIKNKINEYLNPPPPVVM